MNILNLKFSKFSDLNKMLSFYGLFNALIILITLSIISFVAFFHFQLEHDLSSIESWVQKNSWELIVIVKLISVFILYVVLSVRDQSLNYFEQFQIKKIKLATKNIWVMILFLFVMIFSLVKITFNPIPIDILSYFITYIGSIFFFGIDFLLIDYMLNFFKIDKKRNFTKFFSIVLLIFFITTYLAMPYARERILLLSCHFVSLFLIHSLKQDRFHNLFWYLVFFVAPSNVLFGQELRWQQEKSFMIVEYNASGMYLFAIWLLSIFYLFYTRRTSEI